MEQSHSTYRKVLAATVSSVLLETGIETADKDCLGILTEMLQCCK